MEPERVDPWNARQRHVRGRAGAELFARIILLQHGMVVTDLNWDEEQLLIAA